MKSESQVIALLSRKGTKTSSDWEVIQLFCQKQKVSLRFFCPEIKQDTGITLPEFLDWFEKGFGDGEIASLGPDLYTVITTADLGECTIGGTLKDGKWYPEIKNQPVSDLYKIPVDTQYQIDAEMSRLGLEYALNRKDVVVKRIPAVNERVRFWNVNHSGIGVVRSINPDENMVELYCYYLYNEKQLGYSMHEKDIVTYHEYHFEPMTIPAQRRLNTELEKVGKVWYDKLHRIEPVQAKAEKGAKYWYISDKMRLVEETEKGTPTSDFRYRVGNYFTNYQEGLEYLGKICDLLRDRLAKK